MGGAGSGRGRRRRRRIFPFVEEVKRLDAYALFSRRMPVEKVQYFICSGFYFAQDTPDCFTVKRANSDRIRANLEVKKIDCLPNVSRYLFICPTCYARRRFLCLLSNCIACRGCLKLAYRSQNATFCHRLINKIKKLERVLKVILVPALKPKGMHRKTFHYLSDKWFETELMAMSAFVTRIRSVRAFVGLFERLDTNPMTVFSDAIETGDFNITEKVALERYSDEQSL